MSCKRILIVDDSEIDREILKNILHNEFDIIETDNGYEGLEIILSGKPRIDTVLLDISMPVLDGFTVLRLMNENKIANLPVVLITAEATKANVQRAVEYNVSGFISKPFDADLILSRLKAMLDIQEGSSEIVIPERILTETDISEINTYISKLREIYRRYLKNNNMDDGVYLRVSALTELLISEYSLDPKNSLTLDEAHISIISKAAYFYDIGHMVVPDAFISGNSDDETDFKTYESHTNVGADIIWLDHSPSCRYFIEICGDMCMHHHERHDGKGFPHKLRSGENTIYTQICSLAIKFDSIFSKRPDFSDSQFDFVLKEMSIDSGEFSLEMISLLKCCKSSVLSYYRKSSGLNKRFK